MKPAITYSPAYTIVPTYECFNRCTYCNFRLDIGSAKNLSTLEAKQIFKKLDPAKVVEVLILSGEVHPDSIERQNWFTKIHEIGELSLKLGFLPHTNAGVLTWSEMKQLKVTNVYMGLMLEQVQPKFLQTVHKYAPGKHPQIRLQQLEWAGKLKIPFTTGLLLGIGETELDIKESLSAIALIHRKWGHIQEVILQPHSVGNHQLQDIPTFNPNLLPQIITLAKKILPEDISIQIPPNLVPEANFLLDCLAAGATDLGGISPKDEVNPDYPHSDAEAIAEILKSNGWRLEPRLPVYPRYYSWLSPRLQKAVDLIKQRNNFPNW